jgi:membrane-bound ClpP family serine protease
MITLGVILLIIGLLVASIHFLIIIGAIMLVIGSISLSWGRWEGRSADAATTTERWSLRRERSAQG